MVGEELVVYPALIDSLKDGQQTVDRNRLEHQGVKTQLKMFQDLSSTDPQFVPTLKALLVILRFMLGMRRMWFCLCLRMFYLKTRVWR